MTREEKNELKLLRKFSGYLDAKVPPIRRWKLIGSLVGAFGWAMLTFSILSAYTSPNVTFGHVVWTAISATCAFVGAVYTMSAQQWPVFSKFLERGQMTERISKLEKNET